MFRAIVVAAMLALLAGCIRPQGAKGLPNIEQSPSPVAVAHAPLTIASPVFHSDEVGVAYAPVTLSAAGGLPPYSWTLVGALPAGLTLSSEGIVSGTPTQSGIFAFSVQVLDFGNNDTAGVPASIAIVPRLTASLISSCATECDVELGCVSVCGAFGQVSGGAAPLTYTRTSGALPAGTTLNGLGLNGTFVGLPGRLQFTVQVTDGFGATSSISPTFDMFPHISLSGGTCSYRVLPCTVALSYSGGMPPGSPSLRVVGWSGGSCSFVAVVICPQPPITGAVGGGVVTITIGPVGPNAYPHPVGTFTLSLAERTLCGPGSNCASGNVSLTLV